MLINGAPSSGKSTLARMYVQNHPLALALDIDTVRSMVGQWLDDPQEAGVLARRMAIAMARVHLGAGHDVVVPQFLGRLDFVQTLEDLCRETGAEFVEVALLSNPQDAVARFLGRSHDPKTPEHLAAWELRHRRGGTDELPHLYARLLDLVASRPSTRTVVTVEGQIEQAYRDLSAQIAGA